MQLIYFTQFSKLDLATELNTTQVSLIATPELLMAYGVNYYILGWHQLMQRHKQTEIFLWLDCQDNQPLALQAIYANVTGIIVAPPCPKKLQEFAKQQGVMIVTSAHEIANG